MYLFRNMQNIPAEKLGSFLLELSENAAFFGVFEIGEETLVTVSCQKNVIEPLIARYQTARPMFSNIQRKVKQKRKKNVLTQKP